MARSPQQARAPPAPRTIILGQPISPVLSKNAQASTSKSTTAASSTQAGPPLPTRTSTRHRTSTSISSSTTSSAPFTPGPTTPLDSYPTTPAGPSRLNPQAKPTVEGKAHQLRNAGEKERTACPYPDEYGGGAVCGVADEDAEDEVLMAVAGACAVMNNRALSPDELAAIAFGNGWARAPSAAIEPSTTINNAIRAHHKRCERAVPPRNPLLSKYQLQGAVNEANLQSALHPQAFDSSVRPKGTVWYLSSSFAKQWANPFEGVDLNKAQARKPTTTKKKTFAAPSNSKPRTKKAGSMEVEKADTTKAKSPPTTMPKIVLRLRSAIKTEQEECERGHSRSGSRQRSESIARNIPAAAPSEPIIPPIPVAAGGPSQTASMPIKIKRANDTARKAKDVLDSSSDSDTSDSDIDMITELPFHRIKPKSLRKPPPPPISIAGFSSSPRNVYLHSHRPGPNSPRTPFDAFLPSPTLGNMPLFAPPPHSSPFPSHSLDNTSWTVRQDQDLFAQFETSSSSSDDEMRDPRDPDWGMASGIIERGEGEASGGIVWTAAEDEANVKEATDALRVLFPTSRAEQEEQESEPKIELNRLDNRPTPSEASTINESVTTTVPHLLPPGCIKSRESGSVPLAGWSGQSSPIASPNFRATQLPLDASPTLHLSKLRHSFDSGNHMDIDEPAWVDEIGEGPVKSPDESFDDHLSSAGDATMEREKQNDLFAWAAEAAASRLSMPIKQELEDYPSPLTTDPGTDGDADGEGEVEVRHGMRYRASPVFVDSNPSSRSRSVSSSQSPSSRSSELPPFEIDSENASKLGLDLDDGVYAVHDHGIICGPESISIDDELDGWLPTGKDKTPQRRKKGVAMGCMTRCTAAATGGAGDFWGMGMGIGTIGVGNPLPFSLPTKLSPRLIRKRSTRHANRRRKSDSVGVVQQHDDVEVEIPMPELEPASDSSPEHSIRGSIAMSQSSTVVAVHTSPTQRTKLSSLTTTIKANCLKREGKQVELVGGAEMEMELDSTDVIGTEDLEAARAEAEAREERSRKAAKARAEQQKQLMEAYKQKLQLHDSHSDPHSHSQSPSNGNAHTDSPGQSPTPWPETPQPWGTTSTDSLASASASGVPQTPNGNAILSPHMLQSVAGLSLMDPQTPGYPRFMGLGMSMNMGMGLNSGVIDPKELVSPTFPILPAGSDLGLGMSFAMGQHCNGNGSFSDMSMDGTAGIQPPVSIHTQAQKMPPASAPESAATGLTGSRANAPGNGNGKSKAAGASVRLVIPKLAAKDKDKVPSPIANPGSAGKQQDKDKGDAMVIDPPVPGPAPAPPSRASRKNASSTAARASAAMTQPSSATTPSSSASSSSGTGANSSVPLSAVSVLPRGTSSRNEKPLAEGLGVSVIDNIPVYVYQHETPEGSIVILRRLDSDFVNATSLLAALGVKADKKNGDFCGTNTVVCTHYWVPPICPSGNRHSNGVSGTWVRLGEAQELVKRFDPKGVEEKLRLILKHDLYSLFANIANLPDQHIIGLWFGTDFVTVLPPSDPAHSSSGPSKHSCSSSSPAPPPNSAGPASRSTAANNKANHYPANLRGGKVVKQVAKPSTPVAASSLATSTTNSMSAPNLTALATSAPGPGPGSGQARPRPLAINPLTTTPACANPTTPSKPTTPASAHPQSHPHPLNNLNPTTSGPKNPLIRTAPATPPDGCPQPKRRRATTVGGLSPLVKHTAILPDQGSSALAGSAISLDTEMANIQPTYQPNKAAATRMPSTPGSLAKPQSHPQQNRPATAVTNTIPASKAPQSTTSITNQTITNSAIGRKATSAAAAGPKVMPITPAPRRATRASVGGEGVVKPRMTR